MSGKVLLLQQNANFAAIADESIHCCVTSPPYFSLRDYGTARWINAGDPDCDHKVGRFETLTPVSVKQLSNAGSAGHQARGICPKCGAMRIDDQIGMETTAEKYVGNMVMVFREIKRILHPSGTVWLNLGDSYAGSANSGGAGLQDGKNKSFRLEGLGNKTGEGIKPKDLVGIPWMVAFALRADGWYLRRDIIWSKPNPMPESVTDRPATEHEYIFLLSKSSRYYFDMDAIRVPHAEDTLPRALRGLSSENKWDSGAPGQSKAHTFSKGRSNKRKEFETLRGGDSFRDEHGRLLVNPDGRNKRSVWEVDADLITEFYEFLDWKRAHKENGSVWEISTKPYHGAHFATYPPDLIEPCILAGASERGVCPKCRSPWVRVVFTETELESGRRVVGLSDKTFGARNNSPDGKTGLHHDRFSKMIGWRPTCDLDCGQYMLVNLWQELPRSNKEKLPDDQFELMQLGIKLLQRRLCEFWQGAETIPAVVFDPFVGSGTTVEVARKHGRSGIGGDLSFEYLEFAKERLQLDKLELWVSGVLAPAIESVAEGHKNKLEKGIQPGNVVNSIHKERKEKSVRDLPLFGGIKND